MDLNYFQSILSPSVRFSLLSELVLASFSIYCNLSVSASFSLSFSFYSFYASCFICKDLSLSLPFSFSFFPSLRLSFSRFPFFFRKTSFRAKKTKKVKNFARHNFLTQKSRPRRFNFCTCCNFNVHVMTSHP